MSTLEETTIQPRCSIKESKFNGANLSNFFSPSRPQASGAGQWTGKPSTLAMIDVSKVSEFSAAGKSENAENLVE